MSRRYLRPGVVVGHVIVLAIALTCLRLGWWQWDVAHESRGTIQNLGYALLWPVFAGSFIYMWLRFLQLEAEQSAGTDSAPIGRAATDRAPTDRAATDRAPTDRAATENAAARREKRHTKAARSGDGVRLTGVGMIDAAADDDSELAAYNRALARLAEQDDDRAR